MSDPTGEWPPPPPEGITVWRNRQNRFLVCRVHYLADPDKRSAAWKAQAKAGMPERGWLRELEISFATPEGEPVFPEFDPIRMVRPCPVLPGARPLRAWDFGHVCPVVLIGQLDLYGRLQILRELILPGASLEALIAAAKAATLELWGEPRQCFDAGDPAGETMTDLGQVRQVMAAAGIMLVTSGLHHGRSSEAAYGTLRTRLQQEVVAGAEGRTPMLLVDPACPVLRDAMAGAFHKSPRPPFKPVDAHPWKDVCDSLRYLNHNLLGASSGFMDQMQKVAAQDLCW